MLFTALSGLDASAVTLLLVSLGVALCFEFINGFHDTANAVATVIYSKSLKPRTAVVLAGICNFVGVHIGGIAVAYSIVHLLPVDLLISVNTNLGMSMIYALLVSAILWNFGTWLLGLPSSSSHTLIGSILGVGMANALREGMAFGSGVNWNKAMEVVLSLLISPIMGFVLAAALLYALKRFWVSKALHEPPKGNSPPPRGIRAALILSGLGVSLAHGSNDGQKGVGLIMLILIGVMPGFFALNPDSLPDDIVKVRQAGAGMVEFFNSHKLAIEKAVKDGELTDVPEKVSDGYANCGIRKAISAAEDVQVMLAGRDTLSGLDEKARWRLRTEILCLNDAAGRLMDLPDLSLSDMDALETLREDLRKPTEYAPDWVLLAVSLALGVGTMVGWKRIVVTIGEKIGKAHMTYAQGASAQIVAATTIALADVCGLPVSTTHVLSSGVAGTMAANGSGLQGSTLRSIALAWILTLPTSMVLAAALFFLFTAIT